MKILLPLLFLIPLLTTSQTLKRQTLALAGNSQLVETNAGNYFLQHSIGQHGIINTFSAEANTLRQGYIQPLPAIVLGGDANELEVVVYPNPFVNGVVVTVEQGIEEDIAMELFDIGGRLISTQRFDSDNQLEIPLFGLPQGAYFLKLTTGRQQTVKQLLKR